MYFWAEIKINCFIGRSILRSRSLLFVLALVGMSNAQLLDMSQISDKYMVENKINKIRVEGTHHMDERSVLGRIGIRTGQSYSPTSLSEKVQNSVSSLYASDLFDDVTAWAEKHELN